MLLYKKEEFNNTKIYYKSKNLTTLNLIKQSLSISQEELSNSYGLCVPKNLSIYIMNSWKGFVYMSTPLYLWPFVGFHLIVLNSKMKKLWPAIGAWSKRYKSNYIIGIKDLQIMSKKHYKYFNKDQESSIFHPKTSEHEAVSHLVIHELTTHALSPYSYPQWLVEGITLNALEQIHQLQKVKQSTIEKLKDINEETLTTNPMSCYIVGYWFVKYINANGNAIKIQLAHKTLCVKQLLNHLSFAGFKAKVLEWYYSNMIKHEIV